MNRLQVFIRRWLVLLSLIVAASVSATETVEIDGIYYVLDPLEQTAEVTGSPDHYASLPAKVVLPSSVSYGGKTYPVVGISRSAFVNCTSLESITIPASVKLIGNYYENYNYLGDQPFFGCSSLKYVKFEDGDEPLTFGYSKVTSTKEYAGIFKGCPIEEVYVGRNTVFEGPGICSPFYEFKNLVKVTIGEGVTEIGDYLFYHCPAITLISLPDNVRSIGANAFAGCGRLATLNLGNGLETIGNTAFYECTNLTKLTLPESVVSIGESAFFNCTSVTEISIGSNLKTVGSHAFDGCSAFTALILPDGFTTMGEYAFANCTKLTIAKLGNSLTELPKGAFMECPALSEMIVPASVESIGDRALYNDSGLAVITMNEGLRTIGSEVFYNNSGVTTFSIPGSVVTIGHNSFVGCTRMTYLTFREGSEILTLSNEGCYSIKGGNGEYDYFYDCPIRVLTLGRNLKYQYTEKNTYEGSAPFYNHYDLRSVKIGKNVTFLWHRLLQGCSGITELVLPDGLEEVHSFALAGCASLQELNFPNPLVLLDEGACQGDVSLESVIMNEEKGNTLSFVIGKEAFSGCSKLTSLTFPAKTVSVGSRCFDGATALK